MKSEPFAAAGFAIVPGLLSAAQANELSPSVEAPGASGGSRSLLSVGWCRDLAKHLRVHPLLRHLVPNEHVAVQCTYFEKSASANWLVAIHQDLSIPVAEYVDAPRLGGWRMKEGHLFVQAPVEVLEQLVAVRLHLDPCTVNDGPLRVVPGSHVNGILSPQAASAARSAEGEIVCVAGQGSAVVMRPLLLHSSSKSRGVGRRRVLHFLYGPRHLPLGLRWQATI